MKHTKDCELGDNWKECPACLAVRMEPSVPAGSSCAPVTGWTAVPPVALRADLCGRLREARRMERVNRNLGNQDWADQWLGETYVLDSLAKGIARRRNRAALPSIEKSSDAGRKNT